MLRIYSPFFYSDEEVQKVSQLFIWFQIKVTEIEDCIASHENKNGKICGTLHDLVPFVQFKKREKHL